MIKFYKVSYQQFKEDFLNSDYKYLNLEEEDIKLIYENIKLPKRATKNSAGYDFYLPTGIKLLNNQSVKIPTGIRCEMDPESVLMLLPRSSLGFKYRFSLDNTCGVIDADYFSALNEGHIQAKIHFYNEGNEYIYLDGESAFMQGIFMNYLKTVDDNTNEERTGGFGSTNKKGNE